MAIDPSRPFRWKEAVGEGTSRRKLEGRRYRRLVAGVYIAAEVPVDPWIEARAALLVAGSGSFVSHHCAARLYGGVVPHHPLLHAAVPPHRSRSEHREVFVHRSRRRATVFRGLPVTSPEDTFLDLATTLPLVDLVVLGDSLLRRGRTTAARLVQAMTDASGRGVRPARRAAGLVRTGVDSPMETRARMLRVLSGLPELETDIRFHDRFGDLLRRLDAGDRVTRTAVEYDGRHHVERVEQWHSDLGRREEFEDNEWRIVTLVAKDIYSTPGETVLRLERILRERGMSVGPLRGEWRRHFPTREHGARPRA